MNQIQSIIDFWFEGVDDATVIDKKALPFRKWFSSTPQFDQEIRQKFETDLRKAADGAYRNWENTSEGLLALILLFDQFPRNIYRNSPKAYAFDHLALSLAIRSIEGQSDQQLPLIQRVFIYMPFMHAEDMKIQAHSFKCFEGLVEEAKQRNPVNVPYYEYHLSYARSHASTIRQFGRFPHRDTILGRS